MSDDRLLDLADRLRQRLSPRDLEATLHAITRAAVELLPDVHYASITINHVGGPIEAVAPTDPMILRLDQAQYESHEGPCYEAASSELHVICPSLAADERWPHYTPVALAEGVRAHAAIRLYENRRARGALNVYSRQVGSFADFSELGTLFSHQAVVALGYAYEIDNLKEAVATRQMIGQAVGIVMERFRLNDKQAFAFLTRLSQDRNVKLRDLAQQLVAESGR